MSVAEFQLKVNLQRLCMISLATRLWERPKIKTEFRQFFTRRENTGSDLLYSLSENILQQLNSLQLPSKLLTELQKTVVYVGEKIFDYFYHVVKGLKLCEHFIEKVHVQWTCDGNIDEGKIIDLYQWDFIRKLPACSCCDNLNFYNLGCINFNKNFIVKHQNDILRELENRFRDVNFRKFENKIYTIMSATIYVCATKPTKLPPSKSKKYIITPLCMFEVCVRHGFSKAVKYYWEELDEIEKISSTVTSAEKCLTGWKNELFMFKKEKYCEILVFLIDHMNLEEKKKFINNNATQIIEMLLYVWPYQELIVNIADFDWKNFDSINVLSQIMNFKTRYKYRCLLKKNTFHDIFETIWNKTPNHKKFSYFHAELERMKTVEELSMYFDEPTVNLILNDPFIASEKETLNALMTTHCSKLVLEGKFDLIDKILHEVLSSTQIKENINNTAICQQLIKADNFSLAEKFLKWHLETDETVKIFKQEMVANGYVSNRVYEIWNEKCERTSNFKIIPALCAEFLKFIFEKDKEIVEFKNSQLNFAEDEATLKSTLQVIFKGRSDKKPEIIDGLFDFCLISSAKKKEVKEKMIEDIENVIDFYAIECDNLMLAETLIMWLYNTPEQRKEIVKNYINAKGAILCKKFLDNRPEPFYFDKNELIRLSNWLKSSGNLKKIKKDLLSIKANTPDQFLSILDKLDKTEDVHSAVGYITSRPRRRFLFNSDDSHKRFSLLNVLNYLSEKASKFK